MKLRPLLLTGLILALPAISACGKQGRLERPEARPGEVRDIDAGLEPGRTLRTAAPRDRNAEPLPPLAAPPAKAAETPPQ
jgi:predicted small lipoprotein YifL